MKVAAGRRVTGALVVEGRRGTLEGVAERMENLGGSAENGRNELTTGGAGEVTSSNLFLKLVVKMGSGLPLMMPSSATMFLMVEGDTLWVLGSKSSILLSVGGGRGLGVGDAGTNGARVCVTRPGSRGRGRPASTSDLTLGTLPSGLTSGPENRVTESSDAGTWAWIPGRGDTKLIL